MTSRTVTRADLSEAVYQRVSLSRSESAALVGVVLDEISEFLVRGETVKLSAFGSFLVRDKGLRVGAAGMAGLYAPQGSQVGFDGSAANGPREIEAHLAPIFAHHPTAAFVGKVREIRMFGESMARRDDPARSRRYQSGGQRDPDACRLSRAGRWRVELFQNTPAAFHGRPEERESLTQELRALVNDS